MKGCCKKIEEKCKLKGIKLTSHRLLIAHIICTNNHPDAEEIYLKANKKDSRISLATVYRSLFLFEKHNIICKLEIGDGKARYEMKDQDHSHHHLININSGEIIEFDDEKLNDLIKTIAKELGYNLTSCKIELKGLPLK